MTNVSRLWAYMPATLDGMSDLMGQVTEAGSLTLRQRAVLVTAAASTLGDSYCSLAWGKKLAAELGSEVAAAVIRGADDGLDAERTGAGPVGSSRRHRPERIEAGDVELLRDAGFDDVQIFAITTFVALRLAFSTVNDALGAAPDSQLGTSTPAPVRSCRHLRPPPGARPWVDRPIRGKPRDRQACERVQPKQVL